MFSLVLNMDFLFKEQRSDKTNRPDNKCSLTLSLYPNILNEDCIAHIIIACTGVFHEYDLYFPIFAIIFILQQINTHRKYVVYCVQKKLYLICKINLYKKTITVFLDSHILQYVLWQHFVNIDHLTNTCRLHRN